MRQISIMQAFTALCAIKIDDMAPILKSLTNHQDFAIFDQASGTTTDQMCEFIYISQKSILILKLSPFCQFLSVRKL